MNLSSALSLILLSAVFSRPSDALFQDEAGKNDFFLPTAGHGILGVQSAFLGSDQQSVVTSSSSQSALGLSSGGCYLSSRSLSDGSLVWRRNVCSKISMNSYGVASTLNHKSYVSKKIYTLDEAGILRTWSDTDGYLISETSVPGDVSGVKSGGPKLAMLKGDTVLSSVLSVNDEEIISFYNIQTSTWEDLRTSAKDILSQSRVRKVDSDGTPTILAIVPSGTYDEADPTKLGYIVAGYTSLGMKGNKQIVLSHGIAVTSVYQSANGPISLKEYKSYSSDRHQPFDVERIEAIQNFHGDSSILAQSSESNDAVYLHLDKKTTSDLHLAGTSWKDDYENAPLDLASIRSSGVGYICDGFLSILDEGKVTIYHGKSRSLVGSFGQDVEILHRIKCSMNKISVITTSRGGLTSLVKINTLTSDVETNWTAEEGLDMISSALFLDKDKVELALSVSDVESQDEEEILRTNLKFHTRIEAQAREFLSFVKGGFIGHITNLVGIGENQDINFKSSVFGLNKVAVVLSNNFHKVMGLDTQSKGSIVWKLDLNPSAKWHKLVHGTSSNKASAFGLGIHHPHSHEILVLSQMDGEVSWKCVDGVRGVVISEESVSVSAPVSQIIPVHGHSHANGGCKQFAALVLEDDTVAVVAAVASNSNELGKLIESGLYTHSIDRESGVLRSVKLNGNGSVETVGQAVFDPKVEKIVNVAYPQRNEVVQSPSTILGDESLLLKYLNPHICVVVTEASPDALREMENEDETGHSEMYKALSNMNGVQVKKPVGATKPGESPPTKTVTPSPTLFINIVDTVSGTVLSRVSHSHASSPIASNDDNHQHQIPVVVTENWIVYAFVNAKSRRTEIGVMTLHEGMIDKYGITAFSSPEQRQTFSSLTDQKPIVLTKTFTVNYPISALGVTNTKGGISSKTILVATGVDGKILKIDRRQLDPRHPFGEPKKTEKEEGLVQYAPLLPMVPMQVESYSKIVENASFIISTSANLESQTCVLACGGPDVFFTRFAPSREFDSLPESFNKLLIVIVVVGLFVVLNVIKRMGDKKNLKLFWS